MRDNTIWRLTEADFDIVAEGLGMKLTREQRNKLMQLAKELFTIHSWNEWVADFISDYKDELGEVTFKDELPAIKPLLELDNGAFEFFEKCEPEQTFYSLDIESDLGFNTLQDAIILYSEWLKDLYTYLTKNNYVDKQCPSGGNWTLLYKKRAVEIVYESNCYWVFLDLYEADEPWSVYYYLEDVIKQLKEFAALKENREE